MAELHLYRGKVVVEPLLSRCLSLQLSVAKSRSSVLACAPGPVRPRRVQSGANPDTLPPQKLHHTLRFRALLSL